MRCTVYAQISRFKLKAKVSLMSPQWGKCSKGAYQAMTSNKMSFQSPQWGKCSKDGRYFTSPIGTGVSVPAMGKVF